MVWLLNLPNKSLAMLKDIQARIGKDIKIGVAED